MTEDLQQRLNSAQEKVVTRLLSERNAAGHWEGELSTSALSTATACMALLQYKKNGADRVAKVDLEQIQSLIDGGLVWLRYHQNEDGGWGDTVKSFSNISTTMLCHAILVAAESDEKKTIEKAESYITKAGGVEAMIARYGKDKTFSVPILTHCALAGLVPWKRVPQLPFELSCFPPNFFKFLQLPVVSYALPALIAIGQVKFHKQPGWNPITRPIRSLARKKSLKVLYKIQPPNGGFLEAAPLTSFVTMSLCAIGLVDNPVVKRAISFLIDSVRDDGSWPIDTNLATWVTTLSINGLDHNYNDETSPDKKWNSESQDLVTNWLLNQQYKEVHPFTNADPGGWAWTDLPGGVPDADDSPGALLALMNLQKRSDKPTEFARKISAPLANGTKWLLDLQNRDGGWPTFCRGWGKLPFDRSSCDITAHVLRALSRWKKFLKEFPLESIGVKLSHEVSMTKLDAAISAGFQYLEKNRNEDGSWFPLWFGNQYQVEEENPVFGTSRVLVAYETSEQREKEAYQNGMKYLKSQQNADFGWGGFEGSPSTVEETSLAITALSYGNDLKDENVCKGVEWLIDQVEAESFDQPSPIGFYFAKLWYFERMYPQVFLASALGRASKVLAQND